MSGRKVRADRLRRGDQIEHAHCWWTVTEVSLRNGGRLAIRLDDGSHLITVPRAEFTVRGAA